MKRSRVSPVAVVEPANACVTSVRRHSPLVRLVAAVVLGAFATVSFATTAHSLGTYCLTSGNGPIGLLGF